MYQSAPQAKAAARLARLRHGLHTRGPASEGRRPARQGLAASPRGDRRTITHSSRAAAAHPDRGFRRPRGPALRPADRPAAADGGAGRDLAGEGPRHARPRLLGSRRRHGSFGADGRRALRRPPQSRPATADGGGRPATVGGHGPRLPAGGRRRLPRHRPRRDGSRGRARATANGVAAAGGGGGAAAGRRTAVFVRRLPGREPGDAAGVFDHRAGGRELRGRAGHR